MSPSLAMLCPLPSCSVASKPLQHTQFPGSPSLALSFTYQHLPRALPELQKASCLEPTFRILSFLVMVLVLVLTGPWHGPEFSLPPEQGASQHTWGKGAALQWSRKCLLHRVLPEHCCHLVALGGHHPLRGVLVCRMLSGTLTHSLQAGDPQF